MGFFNRDKAPTSEEVYEAIEKIKPEPPKEKLCLHIDLLISERIEFKLTRAMHRHSLERYLATQDLTWFCHYQEYYILGTREELGQLRKKIYLPDAGIFQITTRFKMIKESFIKDYCI